MASNKYPPKGGAKRETFLDRFAAGLLGSPLGAALRAQLGAVWVENDTTFQQAGRGWNQTQRDRYDSDRESIEKDALEAWRLNPLARRIVGLTTQYVVGGGLSVGVKHEETHKFVQNFWKHRLNEHAARNDSLAFTA